MSTQPVTPQTSRKLLALVAISAVLLVMSAGLIMFARSGGQPEKPAGEDATAFVPAIVEPEADREEPELQPPSPEQVAELDPPAPPAPSLHEEETLSEEAIELGYEIEQLQAEQGAGGKKKSERKTLKPANLIVVANFDITDVTVNGLPYPEYFEDEEEQGMVLPAGGPYTVNVIYSGKTKTHTLGFKPYETRYLVAEIPGYAGTSIAPSTPPPAKPATNQPPPREEAKEEVKDEKEEQAGRITVYAKPRGDILLDGKEVGQKTPNTIESPDGRHEVQVKYEDGELSEKKVVRVRKGSRIKLFFRQRKDK